MTKQGKKYKRINVSVTNEQLEFLEDMASYLGTSIPNAMRVLIQTAKMKSTTGGRVFIEQDDYIMTT